MQSRKPDLEPPDPDPEDLSSSYWIDRALTTRGPAQVLPSGRWLRYHAWTTQMLQSWTLAQLDRPQYRRFVDLGCGRGDWTAAFATRADEVHACDVSMQFVEETRARLAAVGHANTRVLCDDVRDYPIPRNADLVYIGSVLMYLTEDRARDLLERVHAAAAPGALVIVRDYCTFNLGRTTTQAITGFSVHRRPSAIVAIARVAKLRPVVVRSSPSIYAEQMGNGVTRWPLWLAWRFGTAHWLRASHTFVFRA